MLGTRNAPTKVPIFITCSVFWVVLKKDFTSEESKFDYRDGIFTLLRSPWIDSLESILPAYVAWRASTTTLFLLGS